jgi:UDP:flavonoid glycosyltransferase YjiC (YdhE family)
MARCLLIWELGGGLGHVVPLARIARALLDRGHAVHVALRERSLTGHLPAEVLVWQSPHVQVAMEDSLATYADLLAANGFSSASVLAKTLHQWDQLFEQVAPDLILFEHAPTAMLAATDCGIATVAYGNGFYLPTPGAPLPVLRNWLLQGPHEAEERERRVLDVVNEVQRRRNCRELELLSDLYGTADLTLLATYPELSHFGQRTDACYCGIPPETESAQQIMWPTTNGPRLLLYLRPCPETEAIIAAIRHLRWPAIAVGGSASTPSVAENIRFVGTLPSLKRVAVTCDLAICHAGHGTTAEVLLAGKPLLLVPQHYEQLLLTLRCVQKSLAACHMPGGKESCVDVIARAAEDAMLRQGTLAFARRHAAHRHAAFDRVITQIGLLAGRGIGGTLPSADAASDNSAGPSAPLTQTDLDDKVGSNHSGRDGSARAADE